MSTTHGGHLFALTPCRQGYLEGVAKARALVLPCLMIAAPASLGAALIVVAIRSRIRDPRSYLGPLLGVVVGAGSLVFAALLFLLMVVSGGFAPCAHGGG